jgi:hypothetical protein
MLGARAFDFTMHVSPSLPPNLLFIQSPAADFCAEALPWPCGWRVCILRSMHTCIQFIPVCFFAPTSAHPCFIPAQSIQKLARKPTPAGIHSESGPAMLTIPIRSRFDLAWNSDFALTAVLECITVRIIKAISRFSAQRNRGIQVSSCHRGYPHHLIHLSMNMSAGSAFAFSAPNRTKVPSRVSSHSHSTHVANSFR